MKLLGIAGWKNSGKTTLVCALVKELIARGLRVSTIKRAHHNLTIDQPGKDSFKHHEAGAFEVLLASDKRWVLMHDQDNQSPLSLTSLVTKLDPVDLVIIEGFKAEPIPKIEVRLKSSKGKPLAPDDKHIIAIACDYPLEGEQIPVFDLNNHKALTDYIWLYFRMNEKYIR